MLDKQTQRYRTIRSVLTHLVTNMPGRSDSTRSGTELLAAHTYLHDHCAECGATLEGHDYALVHAQEMVRIGTAAASDVTHMPICPACYALLRIVRQQFAPVDEPEEE
jgi:hypothetical protein